MRSYLVAAVDILQWLEEDAETPEHERTRRDRRIGRRLDLASGQPRFRRVLAWWGAIGSRTADEGDTKRFGPRLAALLNLASGMLALFGFFAGIGIAGVAFGYHGDHPVNLFALIGVLVGIPFVLLILSLLLFMVRALLPASLVDAMAVLNPGRWAGGWLERHVPVGFFDSVSHRASHRSFARWQLLAFSQLSAIGYFIGVFVVALALVVFTDLAFGWSTTLMVDSADVGEGLRWLALPWSGWLPAAVPDAELVEASRFYRLEASTRSGSQAALLGRWWPFVLMTILVYGLVPRLLLLRFANWRAGRSVRILLEEGPEITALLDRMSTPTVDFEGSVESAPPKPADETPGVSGLDIDRQTAIVVWNQAMTNDQLTAWLSARSSIFVTSVYAAEWQSADEQKAGLRRIDKTSHRLLILTKGWEPPLLAFSDFLALTREELGKEIVIVIVPLDTTTRHVRQQDRDVWARALARRPDPKLYVVGPIE